ncbi:uncharacterized protein COLE_05428 [Cutaneotrichosporon oleaginosum]|uniref:uncharacterized protein n=1 Tax=Cutaneotrichosporon oleaginosum TaxID=879819 RepID=UPI001327D356|nr:hypothetical protein COLE_05428 [Cutaneotrichosporon oleaginosum]
MYPTLDSFGDVVVLFPLAYWRPKIWGMSNKRPERGDLVVTTNMTNPAYTVCKRVVGIEGDVVEIEPTRTVDGSKSWAQGRFLRVPKGHIWVVGDNLSNSIDSRDYGPVPLAMVKGKVTTRVSLIRQWSSDSARQVEVRCWVLWSELARCSRRLRDGAYAPATDLPRVRPTLLGKDNCALVTPRALFL